NKINEPDLSKIYKVTFSKQYDPRQVAEEFKKDPNVIYAEPNYIYRMNTAPNDTYFSNQWALYNTGQSGGTQGFDIDALSAWETETGTSTVIIAVIDTGVDYDHEDLINNMWQNDDPAGDSNGDGYPGVQSVDDDGDGKVDEDSQGREPVEAGYTNDLKDDDDENGYIDDDKGWDFKNNDNDPIDDESHGTHCAGIISASGNNGKGITGVCWNADIMPIKFLDSDGTGSSSHAALAIEYAADNGAKVISNSWGGDENSSLINDAIDYAVSNGALLVFSAGNDNMETTYYPAYNSKVIAVAGTDRDDQKGWFSNYGTWVDISAPGLGIYSTVLNDSYAYKSGTSMACPFVAGTAGLLIANNPSLTNTQVRSLLEDNTDPIDFYNISQYKGKLGAGRLNAYRSFTQSLTINSIDPSNILKSEDFTISIYGRGFDTTSQVSISHTAIDSVSFHSPRKLICQGSVPGTAQAGIYDVVVTNTDGKQGTGYDLCSIQVNVSISSVEPTWEYNTAGQKILKIYGSNFSSWIKVILENSSTGASITPLETIITDTIITCKLNITAEDKGVYDIVITEQDGAENPFFKLLNAYTIVDLNVSQNQSVDIPIILEWEKENNEYSIKESCSVGIKEANLDTAQKIIVQREENVPALQSNRSFLNLTEYKYKVLYEDGTELIVNSLNVFIKDITDSVNIGDNSLTLLYYNNTDSIWKRLSETAISSSSSHSMLKRASQDFSFKGYINKSLSYFAAALINPYIVYIYPNPYMPHKHSSGITFTNLKRNGEVKIFTISGELVKKLTQDENTGKAVWNAKNESGKNASSGIYVCCMQTEKGNI
ncbi:S8 family serine peptidase, partial [bacterium]